MAEINGLTTNTCKKNRSYKIKVKTDNKYKIISNIKEWLEINVTNKFSRLFTIFISQTDKISFDAELFFTENYFCIEGDIIDENCNDDSIYQILYLFVQHLCIEFDQTIHWNLSCFEDHFFYETKKKEKKGEERERKLI